MDTRCFKVNKEKLKKTKIYKKMFEKKKEVVLKKNGKKFHFDFFAKMVSIVKDWR